MLALLGVGGGIEVTGGELVGLDPCGQGECPSGKECGQYEFACRDHSSAGPFGGLFGSPLPAQGHEPSPRQRASARCAMRCGRHPGISAPLWRPEFTQATGNQDHQPAKEVSAQAIRSAAAYLADHAPATRQDDADDAIKHAASYTNVILNGRWIPILVVHGTKEGRGPLPGTAA